MNTADLRVGGGKLILSRLHSEDATELIPQKIVSRSDCQIFLQFSSFLGGHFGPEKRKSSLGIPAACYRTENAQIPKSAGETAGKSAGKKRTAGGTVGSSAVSLLFQRNRPPSTAPSSPPQQSAFSRHSYQQSPRHFWGFGRSQSCSRSALGFQI